MHIVFVEGVHGCGKSTVCAGIQRYGYSVMPEVLPLHDPAYVSSTLIWQTRYVLTRLHHILNYHRSILEPERQGHVVFSDRGFLSCLAYCDPAQLPVMQALVDDAIAAMVGQGITFCYLSIVVPPTILWERIQARLLNNPERHRYNEGSFLHFTRVFEFYQRLPWCNLIDGTLPAGVQVDKALKCLSHGSIVSSISYVSRPLVERHVAPCQSTTCDDCLAVTTLSDCRA